MKRKIKRFSEGGMDDYDSSDDAKNLLLAAEREDVERIGDDYAKTIKKKPTFKEAFAEARKAGDKTFEYQGKKYTTELAAPKKSAMVMRTAEQEAADDAKIAAATRKPKSFAEKQGAAGEKMREAYKGAAENIKRGAKSIFGMKSGGKISSASKRADGCAQRGKTRGRMV